MQNKKKIVYGILFLALTVGLSACGASSSKEASTDEPAASTAQTSSSTAVSDSSEVFQQTDTNDPVEDPSLSDVLTEVQSKFQQLEYVDSETGVTLRYNLYIPDNYDETKKYPLLSFIPDDSIVGQDTTAGLTQGYGGSIWATETEQEKHASFVLVPVFDTSTVEGGMGQSGSAVVEDQVNTYLDLLTSLQKEYSIDADRLYATGQSMGGMTLFYINANHPDLFAATLYVASQWEVAQLTALKDQKFFYIVGGGDSKASTGQSDLTAMLEEENVTYSNAEWDAQASAEDKNTMANELIDQKLNANFVHWTTGSVLEGSSQGSEHMASFDYGYTIPAVRDWLFNQSK